MGFLLVSTSVTVTLNGIIVVIVCNIQIQLIELVARMLKIKKLNKR